MKVTYLETPVRYRLPNNVIDFNAYRSAHVSALPAVRSTETLPAQNPVSEGKLSCFQQIGTALDAIASLALTVTALVVLFALIL